MLKRIAEKLIKMYILQYCQKDTIITKIQDKTYEIECDRYKIDDMCLYTSGGVNDV